MKYHNSICAIIIFAGAFYNAKTIAMEKELAKRKLNIKERKLNIKERKLDIRERELKMEESKQGQKLAERIYALEQLRDSTSYYKHPNY